ncbi:hypothetical protein [Chitinibacter tainanensis]|uniref:hypothetical protein n=1 Tax=Chitinibacter tainanensis TaxID=230667 RepID=UPI002356AF81|nr:hypothetical protein [Chitinibacter tainanensis]
MYINVDVDEDEVLEEISDEALKREVMRRVKDPHRKTPFVLYGESSPIPVELEQIALSISIGNHPAAIEMTKEFIYQSCGRIVN